MVAGLVAQFADVYLQRGERSPPQRGDAAALELAPEIEARIDGVPNDW
jgi:hypothetical protein